MSYCDVYIAYLDEPGFDWDNLGPEGAYPRSHGPWFPPRSPSPFYEVLGRIGDGRWEGQALDWGSTGARLYPHEIQAFINEMYGTEPDGGAYFDISPQWKPVLLELRRFVTELDHSKQYILVASEL